MNRYQKSLLSLLAVALSSFDSRHPFFGVDGAIEQIVGVKCQYKTKKLKACIGEKTIWSPSPALDCTDAEDCEPVYTGGWGWEFVFVDGLEEGIEDYDAIKGAMTGLEVTVEMDDDRTNCSVRIGSDTCKMCSVEGCEKDTIKYDCTNLEDGKKTLKKCKPINEDLLYPLKRRTLPGYTGKRKKKNTNKTKRKRKKNILST